jgi:hypothetical protein
MVTIIIIIIIIIIIMFWKVLGDKSTMYIELVTHQHRQYLLNWERFNLTLKFT